MGTLQIHPVNRSVKKIKEEKIPLEYSVWVRQVPIPKRANAIHHKTGVFLFTFMTKINADYQLPQQL